MKADGEEDGGSMAKKMGPVSEREAHIHFLFKLSSRLRA